MMDQQGRLRLGPSGRPQGFLYTKVRTDLGTIASQYGLNDFEWGPIDVNTRHGCASPQALGSALNPIRRGQGLSRATTGCMAHDPIAEMHLMVTLQDKQAKERSLYRAGVEHLREAREMVCS